MARPQPRYKKGDKIGGRYLVHEVKMGGMGEVYLCLDLEQNYPYALKTFQQRYLANPRIRMLFEEEAAIWVALEMHPNIVRCFLMDVLDNQPFVVLDWIASNESQGPDLRGWLRYGPLDMRLAPDFSIDICRGLIHAQKKQSGIVHRDLKPENILVSPGPVAKITDFGLAKVVQETEIEIGPIQSLSTGRQSLMGRGGIVGTPPYMAPEQWLGGAVNASTDVYAVGCVLYEMLTGRCPFQSATLDNLRQQHLEAQIPRLSSVRTGFDALNTLLARCLAKRTDERFAEVDDLLHELLAVYQEQFSETPKEFRVDEEYTAQDYNNRALTYSNLKRYGWALKYYDRTIKLAPNMVSAYDGRAIVYAKLQRYEEALEDHTRAIELAPNNAKVYCNRGVTYEKLERYPYALQDYEKAIELDGNYAQAYRNRGVIKSRLLHFDAALTDYNRAIELDPNDALAHCNLGILLANQDELEKALSCFETAVQLGYLPATQAIEEINQRLGDLPDNQYQSVPDESETDHIQGIIYYNRGLHRAQAGLNDEAIKNYTQAIQYDPTLAQAYSDRGVIYERIGHYNEALVDYTYAINLNPTNALAHNNRGNLYDRLQRFDEAWEDYSRAIELDPYFAQAYYNAGVLLNNRGKLGEALPYFEKAAQFGDPDGAFYAEQVSQLLKIATSLQIDPGQFRLASIALQQAGSVTEMRRVVRELPFMKSFKFISFVEQDIAQLSPGEKFVIKQRLDWLKQIAQEQNQ